MAQAADISGGIVQMMKDLKLENASRSKSTKKVQEHLDDEGLHYCLKCHEWVLQITPHINAAHKVKACDVVQRFKDLRDKQDPSPADKRNLLMFKGRVAVLRLKRAL